ncbi:type II toxin-antitoxin system VapB family antitoxin [Mesorhizobium sp. YR577]|jgi:antitoxin VapB|uniref:type II toxin-antitoxin system VapB family antitoxin n=1 Tax=Mesorhizobium sp. YR577 TaxID=1884373 RepID=UPI0008E41240|nr:type II toxin-antitoxin system VapB family antitoxin [Mesorhizobium sp. YR577]SFU18446.1 antitoxin VapB [Mesorhizobium sp. YR577]
MPLFIRDEAVDRLASEVQNALKTSTKKEAVRIALEHELERARRQRPLTEVVADLQARVAALGPGDPDFDMKRFTDEMWGDI